MIRFFTLLLIFLAVASLTSCNLPRKDEPSENQVPREFQTQAAQETQQAEDSKMLQTPKAAYRQTLQSAEIERQATRQVDERLKTQQAKATAVVTFTHAFLKFDPPKAIFSTHDGNDFISVESGCWPPHYHADTGFLTVTVEGIMQGECDFDNDQGGHSKGVLSGELNLQTGMVNFHLDVITHENSFDSRTIHYVVDGTAILIEHIASGLATFNYARTFQGETNLATAGTVPFTLEFAP